MQQHAALYIKMEAFLASSAGFLVDLATALL
jgi:hypothetical protein